MCVLIPYDFSPLIRICQNRKVMKFTIRLMDNEWSVENTGSCIYYRGAHVHVHRFLWLLLHLANLINSNETRNMEKSMNAFVKRVTGQ